MGKPLFKIYQLKNRYRFEAFLSFLALVKLYLKLNSPLLHVIYFDWWHMFVIPVPGTQAGGMPKVEFSLAHMMSSKPARTIW